MSHIDWVRLFDKGEHTDVVFVCNEMIGGVKAHRAVVASQSLVLEKLIAVQLAAQRGAKSKTSSGSSEIRINNFAGYPYEVLRDVVRSLYSRTLNPVNYDDDVNADEPKAVARHGGFAWGDDVTPNPSDQGHGMMFSAKALQLAMELQLSIDTIESVFNVALQQSVADVFTDGWCVNADFSRAVRHTLDFGVWDGRYTALRLWFADLYISNRLARIYLDEILEDYPKMLKRMCGILAARIDDASKPKLHPDLVWSATTSPVPSDGPECINIRPRGRQARASQGFQPFRGFDQGSAGSVDELGWASYY